MEGNTDSLLAQFFVVAAIIVLLFFAAKYKPGKHSFPKNLSTSALIILTGLFSSIKIDPPERDKVINIRKESEDFDSTDTD